MNKHYGIGSIILFGVCAVIWVIISIINVVTRDAVYLIVLNSVGAILWVILFIYNLINYIKN